MNTTKLQRVVLVGAGNANLQVLRRWVSQPLPHASLVLISDSLLVPYSGMIPGWVNRTYTKADCLVDLVPLCGRGGVTLVEGTALGLDRSRQEVILDNRRVAYDWVAINVGSEPEVAPGTGPSFGVAAKPLTHLVSAIEDLDERVDQSLGFHLAVVGSGAGGSELTLALKKRYGDGVRLTLIDSNPEPLSSFSRTASRTYRRGFEEAGIALELGARVVGQNPNGITLENGRSVECDGVLWVTRGTPNAFTQSLDLPRDPKGFIRVDPTLRSPGDPRVFATGDAVAVEGHRLAKAGVYAVRQGPVLWDNLEAALEEKGLRPYRPQSRFLTLLNLSDGRAVMNYGPLSLVGRWAWRWKDHIDRTWMKKLTDLSQMPSMDPMRCGGCGSKVSPRELDQALRSFESVPGDGSVGVAEREDAAVFNLGQSQVVESVDFFRGLPLDPYLLGQVVALNSLSDLWAMGAAPRGAQAIVVLPEGQTRILGELLEGMRRGLEGSGASLVGGHTCEGAELALGMAVTGEARDPLLRKNALQVGDVLVLTQALGAGTLLAAYAEGRLTSGEWQALRAGLIQSNGPAAELLLSHGVRAATDVTGFGLGGHLLEMLRASGCSGELWIDALPTLPGFVRLCGEGVESSLAPGNREAIVPDVVGLPPGPTLWDPQTSGGLLAGVAEARAEELVSRLREAGYEDAAVIGRVTEAGGKPELDLRANSL